MNSKKDKAAENNSEIPGKVHSDKPVSAESKAGIERNCGGQGVCTVNWKPSKN